MKIGFIIPARLKSTRLKKKILLRLGNQNALEWTIDRAKSSLYIDEVVVATTYLPSDSEISKICQKKSIRYFQGDPDDVLLRIKNTVEYFDFDYAVNITPDNTLFSIHMIDLIAAEIRENPNIDYFKFKNPMLGTGLYALKREALQTICDFKKVIDTEIWGPLFNPKYFKVKELDVPENFNSKYRLTMDTVEDYHMLTKIYDSLVTSKDKIVDLNTIIDFLDKNDDIANINLGIEQRNISPLVINEINKMFDENFKRFIKIKKIYYKRSD